MINLVSNNYGGGGWEGLYCDGVLLSQGHSLSTRDFIELLQHLRHEVEINHCSDNDMERLGYNFPDTYEEFSNVVYE